MTDAVPAIKARPSAEVREFINDVVAEYAYLIDANRLEEWLELFTQDCDYKVVTRENVEQGLPNIMIWCDNWEMLRDRVESYRHVNEYNLHWDRHVVGPVRFDGRSGELWLAQASYLLAQTTLEGATSLFSAGVYEFAFRVEQGKAKIASLRVVADTALIPTLLATPI